MRADLPTGTVTLLFTDIEASTRLLHQLGDDFAGVLAEHHRLLRAVWSQHGGVEVDTAGDAFFVAFARASDAVAAAEEAQADLEAGPLRVRMGLHTGEPVLGETGYVGRDVHLAARIAAVAHGGQIVVSRRTRDFADVGLTDLGEHRLKDFDEPVWLFQVGAAVFPPLRTIANTNLPRPASSFVGRAREVGEVAALLRNGARFVTLSGPGGTGKTRLALEAASELVPAYANGVFWVPLATIRDPALVPATIAQTVGAKEDLQSYFSGKRSLLLLDNLEQVVDAATDLAALVEACPGLALLVTSRELLRVRGEVEFPVGPLAEEDAVTLFCARSRLSADRDVEELCRRLDQLPLAVELAAARTSVLSPPEILARIGGRLDLLKGGRDAEARHVTLRATIEWSYDLLTPVEQRLFARLGVVAGGCRIEAAEAICGHGDLGSDLLDGLASLIDKSLLRKRDDPDGHPRVWMLETIHEHALEKLTASGELERLRDRHLDWFSEFARAAEPQLSSGRALERNLPRVEADHPNLRAALRWATETGRLETTAQLGGDLWPFWFLAGHWREGYDSLHRIYEQVKDLPEADVQPVLSGLGELARFLGHTDEAIAIKEHDLAISRRSGLDEQVAAIVSDLADINARRGSLDAAMQFHHEAVAIRRRIGGPAGIAHALAGLGETHLIAGRPDLAEPLHREALELLRADGDPTMVANACHSLAEDLRRLGHYDEARVPLEEGLRLSVEAGYLIVTADCIDVLACMAAQRGAVLPAARLWGAAEAIRRRLGFEGSYPGERDRIVSSARTRTTDLEFERTWSEGQALQIDEATDLAFSML